MPRKVIARASPPSSNKACCFCGLSDDNELEYGKFHEYNGIVTHYYCLLLSSNMQQKGRDDEGILGFLPEDINKELRRGKRLTCCYCRKTGATLGCCNTKCKKIFHFPCGLKFGSLHQFFGEFRSYCKNHRPKQKIDDHVSEEVKNRDDMICYICYDEVKPYDTYGTLWAPCCKKNAWFHRTCVQQLATSAGYFFKCPLCNNKTEFQKAMLDQGIFIPSQDASWELVPNAFEELLYRHNRCDADDCLCPKGREHTSTNAKWELTLCRTCGSQGIHMACGELKWVNPIWECSECTSILKKSMTSDSESNSMVRVDNGRRKLRKDMHLLTDDETSDSDISVGTEATEASTSELSFRKIQESETQKTFEEPVALRITRRSVIPIPRSPVNTQNSMTHEDLSPKPKKPRFSDSIVERNRRESIDSDDDIMVISGPSKSENSISNGRKSPIQRLSINNFSSVNTNVEIEDPNLKKESQEAKKSELPFLVPYETLNKPQPALMSQVPMETERRVVEIDLSESEYTIPKTLPTDSIANEIPVVNSVVDPPELNIMITNVTSLAPEAFENVQEQKMELNDDVTIVPSRTSIFNESNGGFTSQTPIVLDDEPLPIAPTNHIAGNNNHNLSSKRLNEQIKIMGFGGTGDSSGNPPDPVLYGITILGTDQTLPLSFVIPENKNSKATSAINCDVNKPIAISNDCNAWNENHSSGPRNNLIHSSATLIAAPNATKKPENRQIDSTTTTTTRTIKMPTEPQSNASSLSLSVPLKAVINERFRTPRTVRKSNDKRSNNTVTGNNQDSSVKVPGAPSISKSPVTSVAETPLVVLNGGFTKMPGSPILPKTHVTQPTTPLPNGFDPSMTTSKVTFNSKANNSLPSGIDATTISKMFALLPPEPFAASQANSHAPPRNVSSTVPRTELPVLNNNKTTTEPSVLNNNKTTTININGNNSNANTTWLSPAGTLTKINTNPEETGVTITNLNPSTQLLIPNTTNNRQQIIEPQLFQLIRVNPDGTSTDDCDGDAGSDPAVQPASVNNPRNAKPSHVRNVATSPNQCAATFDVGRRNIYERLSDANGDTDTDDASERSASTDRSDACNRTGLIYKNINLRNLKFSTCGTNIVKMTLYDTYTVNIKLDSSFKNTKYSSSRRTTKSSLNREAKAWDIESCDSNDDTNSFVSPSSTISSDKCAVLDQYESTSQDSVSTLESVNLTNDLTRIDVASRGQDELKENLDPIPPSTNSTYNAATTVDRKSKFRLRSDVNHSMRSLNEKEGQKMICEKKETPGKVASHEPQFVQNHSNVLYNGWKDTSCHEETKVQNVLLDRSVETIAKNLMPRNPLNNNSTAEDSDHIHVSKRKRISSKDENISEMQNFAKLTTTKESNNCYYKRKWISSDDISRTKKFRVNSLIDGRKKNASVEPLSCKVSIDLMRIRDVLTTKLNVSHKILESKFSERSVTSVVNGTADKHVSESKSIVALSKYRSFDNLTFDPGVEAVTELRKSKSLEDLSSLSSPFCVDNILENRRADCKIKKSFEKHDCVR